jgi:hypothetical protein
LPPDELAACSSADEKYEENLEPVEVRERPPMSTIPAYCKAFAAAHGLSATAGLDGCFLHELAAAWPRPTARPAQ